MLSTARRPFILHLVNLYNKALPPGLRSEYDVKNGIAQNDRDNCGTETSDDSIFPENNQPDYI